MRVWRLRGCPPHACQRFQLTHPWGCDEYHIPRTRDNYISTHTPVRVWHKPHLYITVFDISTHTPVRVWPDILQTCNGEDGHFNSHTREGVTQAEMRWDNEVRISTHTPVRVWLWRYSGNWPMIQFQLTHPWGCDKKMVDFVTDTEYISTHTPVRVWQMSILRPALVKISTHTPVRVWL